MAKFKKPILLQEEFAAGEISSNPTTPAVKTTVDTVGTEQIADNKSGEQVRAEIVQDVDTILTNLEQLSKQITEDVNTLINDLDSVFEAFDEDFKYEAINEDFMAKMLQAFTDMKNYAALKSAYKPGAVNVMNSEVEKVQKGAEFDAAMDEKIEQAVEKLKEKWNEKIKAEGAKHADNIPKKTAIQTKLREMRDQAVKDAKTGTIKKKVDSQKAKLNLGEDAKIKEAQEKLAETVKDFPLSAEGLLAKTWDKEKNEIDLEISIKKIDMVTDAETEYLDDPDLVDKLAKKADDKKKKEAAEAKEDTAKFEADLKAQEEKLAKQEAEAMNDPNKKEAIEAIKLYYGASKEYLNVLGGVSADLTDEEKDAINSVKKKYNAAKKGFTVGKLKKTGDYTEDEASEEIANMTANVEAAVDKFKDIVAKAEGDAQTKKNDIKAEIKELKDKIKEAQGEVEAAKVSADGNEEDPALVSAKAKVTELETKKTELEDSIKEESVEIEEGNEFGAARAEAIAKGEKTFKVGDEEYPVEDVSKDDKENAEEFVEEAKEELPKKVTLYEGMSVADRFKALM